MKAHRELQQRWNDLVSKIATPVPMLRGSVCQAQMKKKRPDGSPRTSVLCTLYTRKVKGRTVTRSLNAQSLPAVRQAVENFHEFQAVVEKFKAVGEELARAEGADASKKNFGN
jgi:cell fate (sporulation/competence/biofilm development) regulator YlbF (YheA/YmcA/DUF963 family)